MKDKTDDISMIADSSRPFLDYNRLIFFRSELDTLVAICSLAESRAYKESFILLRTVFEKFLYFWLMLEGIKYRWPIRYTIQPTVSSTPKEARDATMSMWRNEWHKGNPSFRYVSSIDPGVADNVITVIYEPEAQYGESGLAIPIYSSMLENYRPSLAHIPAEIPEGMVPKNILGKQIQEQKMNYNAFFYIKNIFRNLIRNNLIKSDQLDKIKVHYSFLSEYVHPGLASLDIWRNIHPYDISPSHEYPEDILKELIFFYVAKLMQLYIGVYLTNFRKRNPNSESSLLKYENITKTLDELTKEFWFFDNAPTSFDIQNSDSKKRFAKRFAKAGDSEKVIYYDNPAERLKSFRYFYP